MHDFGWKCSPVERAGSEAPPCRDAVGKPVPAKLAETVAKVVSAAPAPEAAKPAAPTGGKPSRPQGLAVPRGGKPDNLQMISGVGPKLEKTLHGLGFFHFDQIAAWSRSEVEWVDEHLRFKGRIERDEWIPQASLLAAGDMDQFARLFGTGGLKGKSGTTRPGNRTRKT